MTTDELRAKFEAWWTRENPNKHPAIFHADSLAGFEAGYASRDAEVEALQDALFQISVRLKAEREPDMDDMSWHTQLIARAQWMANQCQRIESAPVVQCQKVRVAEGHATQSAVLEYTHERIPGGANSWIGKRVRLVVEDGE